MDRAKRLVIVAGFGLSVLACTLLARAPTPTQQLDGATASTMSATPSPAGTGRSNAPTGVWYPYAPPKLTPATAIPPPAAGLRLPDGARVVALLGTGETYPFTGSTNAVMLAFYHPLNQRVSLVSLPPDLFIYIPGYTMQRLSAAFAAVGPVGFIETMTYNFSITPQEWAVIHLDSLEKMVDDLGGLSIEPLEEMEPHCAGIDLQASLLTGGQTRCYVSYRFGTDEKSRSLRQQQVFRVLYERLVGGGNLIRLADLYQDYGAEVETNLGLADLEVATPLMFELAAPGRMAFFAFDQQEFDQWEVPGPLSAPVILPDRSILMRVLQAAADFIATPAPADDRARTLEAELTQSPTPTNTGTVTNTPTRTNTPWRSPTPTRTITLTCTITLTRTITQTRTLTLTRTITSTPTVTTTGTETQTPTVSLTPTFTETPTVTMTVTVTETEVP